MYRVTRSLACVNDIVNRSFVFSLSLQVFPQQANIKRHKEKMHNVKCPVCSRVFKNKTDMPAHYKSAHPGEECAPIAIRNFKTAYVLFLQDNNFTTFV